MVYELAKGGRGLGKGDHGAFCHRVGASSLSNVLVKLGQNYSFEQAAASDYDTLMKQWIVAEKARLNVP